MMGRATYGTTFTETEALLAALAGDHDGLYTILSSMTRRELKELRDAMDYVRQAIRTRLSETYPEYDWEG